MQIHRRAYQNQALNFAIGQANALGLPVVVYEGLRPDYDQANDRIHQFIIEGAMDNHRHFAQRGIRYCFYLMPDPQTGNRRAVAQLALEAALLVTDDFPTFVVPAHNRAIVKQVDCPVYAVDANGVVPIREMKKEEYAARTIRPQIHRLLPAYLWPIEELAPKIKSAKLPLNLREETALDKFDLTQQLQTVKIDHTVRPCRLYHGGRTEALKRLDTFISQRLINYARGRNLAGEHWTSELSPYLHFGHISALEVAWAVLQAEAPEESIDAFLEEMIVRRELSYNFCHFNAKHASFEALPAWARQTLFAHEKDKRPYVYALDGRNPNTYTGILWCFGKHDRASGPQRPVFGLVRYMTSQSIRRKINFPAYKAWVESCERG